MQNYFNKISECVCLSACLSVDVQDYLSVCAQMLFYKFGAMGRGFGTLNYTE